MTAITREDNKITITLGRADVLYYDLAREILYRAGFCLRRDGDDLFVFKRKDDHSTGFYARATEYPPEERLARLYVDEGYQTDCLHTNGEVTWNDPWCEMVDMTSLLGLFVNHFHPDVEWEHRSFMGRGFQQQWNYDQYVKVLVAAAPDRHPKVRFTQQVRKEEAA